MVEQKGNLNAPKRMTGRVWDLPTRLFHWSLLLCVVGAVVSGKVGGNAMVWHYRLGLAVMSLLLFRLAWGLFGGHWSRFATFVPTPGRLWRYLRGQSRPDEHVEVGHNPLGSLSVLALLAILAAQVTTGLIVDDEIATTGPLIRFVESATALAATSWHRGWGQRLLLLLVLLHVGAIVVYRFAKNLNLVTPMVKGDKEVPVGTPVSRDTLKTRLWALLWLLLSIAAALWVDAQAS